MPVERSEFSSRTDWYCRSLAANASAATSHEEMIALLQTELHLGRVS